MDHQLTSLELTYTIAYRPNCTRLTTVKVYKGNCVDYLLMDLYIVTILIAGVLVVCVLSVCYCVLAGTEQKVGLTVVTVAVQEVTKAQYYYIYSPVKHPYSENNKTTVCK